MLQLVINLPTIPSRFGEYEQTANVCPYLSIDGEVRGYSKPAAFRMNGLLFIGWMTWVWHLGGHARQKACMLCDFTSRRKYQELTEIAPLLHVTGVAHLAHTRWLFLERDKTKVVHSFNGMKQAVHA